MSTLKTSFAVTKEIAPIYTGGPVAIGGGLLATTLQDGVQVTELDTGAKVARIKGDGEPTTSLAIAPDGEHLVVCSRSLLVSTYTLPDARLLRSVKAHDAPVITTAIDSTSTLLATGGAEGLVKVWDLAGGFVTHNFKGHGGIVSALRFFGKAGGRQWYLASGADDCRVRVWDLVSGKNVGLLEGHSSVVRGLDFDDDGTTLLSAARDQVINVWDLRSMKLKAAIPVYESLEAVGFLPAGTFESDAALCYYAGEQNRIRVMDLSTKKEVASSTEASTPAETVVQQVHLHGDSLISVRTNQTILTHSIASRDMPLVRRTIGQFDEVIDLAYVLGDAKLAVASNSEDIHLLDPATNGVDVLAGHADIVLSIDTDFSGRYLASGGKDNAARVWDLHTQSCLATYTGHAGSVAAVALSRVPPANDADAPPLYLYTGAQDLTLKCWRVSSAARSRWTAKAHDRDINAIDVSPDDRLLASASQDRTCKLWDAETGTVVAVLKGHKRGVWTCRFSVHDKLIATGSGDRTVKLWSLSDYTCVKTFEGHTNSVLKCVWLSGGRQVASAGGDGLVKVWDVKSGECSTTLDNHEDRVWSLAVSRDDATLVSGGGDSVVSVWQDTTALVTEQRAVARERLVEREQQLDNRIRSGDWREAIRLALSLDRPGKLLKLFADVLDRRELDGDGDAHTGLYAVDAVLQDRSFMLRQNRLARLLTRCRDWNTNARTCGVAQAVLSALLAAFGAEELIELGVRHDTSNGDSLDAEIDGEIELDAADTSADKREVIDVKTLVDPLIAYTERHYSRAADLLQASYLVDFTLKQMTAGVISDV